MLSLLAVAVGAPLAVASHATTQTASASVMRLGVVSFYNPRLMYLKYQPLADYLSRQTPWRFELDLSSSYQRTVERLCSGDVQLAYLGPFSYLRAHHACGAEPIVRLNTRGLPTYQSYIMVRQTSPYKTLADLRGATFGFGARLSTSSHLVPRAMLLDAGLEAGRAYRCRYYAHHERAARAVLLGEVVACGVRDLTGEQFATRGLRVLARSAPVPNFPLVVGRSAPADFRRIVTDALVNLPRRTPAIAAAMAEWDAELAAGFAPTSPDAYAPVLALAQRVFGPSALSAAPERFVCPPNPLPEP